MSRISLYFLSFAQFYRLILCFRTGSGKTLEIVVVTVYELEDEKDLKRLRMPAILENLIARASLS